MALSIREADAKRLLWSSKSDGISEEPTAPQTPQAKPNGLSTESWLSPRSLLNGVCAPVDSQTDLEDLPRKYPWLLSSRLTVKPDVLLKRRGKSGLVKLDLTWDQAQAELQKLMDTEFTYQGLTGTLDHFILEPFFPHDEDTNEYYVAIRTLREGDEVLFSVRGGINVGNVDEHARRVLIPVSRSFSQPCEAKGRAASAETPAVQGQEEGSEECTMTRDDLAGRLAGLFCDVADSAAKTLLPQFVAELYQRFCDCHFAFLEINPFCFDARHQTFVVLDCAAKLDHAAEFLCDKIWGQICFPSPFGRRFTEEERYIR